MAQLHAIADTLDEPLEALQERGERGRRLEKSFREGLKNPTGIVNPAEYMSSVTKTEEDTNGDGNIDKVTIEKEEE